MIGIDRFLEKRQTIDVNHRTPDYVHKTRNVIFHILSCTVHFVCFCILTRVNSFLHSLLWIPEQ